jgi:hypothetical protein
VVFVAVVAFFWVGPGRDIRTFWNHGFIQEALNNSGEDRAYSASREANLKAISVALNLYEESEERYPAASGWMDAIGSRLRTTDMSEAEAAKKLVRPNMKSPQAGQFGYAINDAVAGKYKGDLKDPKTVLVFETTDRAKNAHGNPKAQKGGLGVTISGEIVHL